MAWPSHHPWALMTWQLLDDRERLKEEREKARANRGKFGGVSSQARDLT
jgi:hypothetical protein